MTLNIGSLLQGGKYRIIKVLGQGGFGITYLADQTMLERKVAIKEFFMKEFCERDETTSHVTLGSGGIRATVDRFREKFLKEARNIAKLKHPHIIQILDVFEENGTAYYVMEYAENGSLLTLVAGNKPLPESQATRYILQLSDALAYIHERRMNHLDVKPGNVMLNEKDEAVLIDFGLSKQYDEGGQQTSTTPVGLSEGYAPMEQYKQGGVKEFSPETDIYALGATFFKLLTGKTPPGASDVYEDGLPIDELKKKGVSQVAIDVITKAMEPRRKKRMHDVKDVIDILSAGHKEQESKTFEEKPLGQTTEEDEETVLIEPKVKEATKEKEVNGSNDVEKKSNEYIASPSSIPASKPQAQPSMSVQRKLFIVAGVLAFIGIGLYLVFSGGNSQSGADDTNVKNFVSVSPKTFIANGISFKMVPVDGGTFQMGATLEQNEPYDDEKPVHSVTLSDYYIGQTEVTQALWKAVMGSNPSNWKGETLPVERVSWNDCQTFITKLNQLTGQKFRLPTEAEWEYAARGGNKSKGYKYSGSNTLGDVAWYDSNGGNETHPVAAKQPNELGLYDMSGNVWEWCQDWYDENYYKKSPSNNPTGPSSGSSRVYRGGSWYSGAWGCRVSRRDFNSPSLTSYALGFRLAL